MSAPPSPTPASTPSEPSPVKPLRLYDSWWSVGVAALLACLALTGCVWVSAHLQADAALHTVALFVHLTSLVLGLGAVLVADYHGLLWLVGRCTLHDTLHSTARLHLLIWTGLTGLVISGVMLHPDLTSPLTRAKLALILVLTLNGLQAGLIAKRLEQRDPTPPTFRLLAWGGAAALISQSCWWGALVIGFLNSQS